MEQWLIALPGIIGLVATVIKILADWRKAKAEASAVIVDGAVDVVKLLREEIAEVKDENRKLKARVRRLEGQVKKLGAEPVNGE